jgi:hypothetical protein
VPAAVDRLDLIDLAYAGRAGAARRARCLLRGTLLALAVADRADLVRMLAVPEGALGRRAVCSDAHQPLSLGQGTGTFSARSPSSICGVCERARRTQSSVRAPRKNHADVGHGPGHWHAQRPPGRHGRAQASAHRARRSHGWSGFAGPDEGRLRDTWSPDEGRLRTRMEVGGRAEKLGVSYSRTAPVASSSAPDLRIAPHSFFWSWWHG